MHAICEAEAYLRSGVRMKSDYKIHPFKYVVAAAIPYAVTSSSELELNVMCSLSTV